MSGPSRGPLSPLASDAAAAAAPFWSARGRIGLVLGGAIVASAVLVHLAGADAGFAVAAGCAAAALALAALMARNARLERLAREARDALAASEAARAKAEADNAAKSRFLAEMSHELRTPLNTVLGFSEMMAQEVLGPHQVEAYGGYARDIHASGRHLLSLADDLLDLARIETGHRTLLETPVAFCAIAADGLAMMAPQAQAQGVALTDETPADLRVWADARAVRQMALNLLANAVKFTAAGGTVRVVAGRTATGEPYFAVEDTGRGGAESELPLPLSAQPKESASDPQSGRGAGLGLAIVEGLAGLHGARLVFARAPGGGTRATLLFPPSRALT